VKHAVLYVQVNVTTIDGATPLFHACSAGSLACLELLLQSDARPHALAIFQPSPIHEAVSMGGYEIDSPHKSKLGLILYLYRTMEL